MARFTLPRNMYIRNAIKVTRPGVDAEVYVDIKGLRAVTFAGKAQNPTWHHRFPNQAGMERRIKSFFDECERLQEYKAERKAKQAEERQQPHGHKVGDIFYTSWGYDQTNVEFYQVVEIPGPHTVKLREICANHEESRKSAIKDHFYGEEVLTRRVVGTHGIKIGKSQRAYPWDGRPKYYSNDH